MADRCDLGSKETVQSKGRHTHPSTISNSCLDLMNPYLQGREPKEHLL
jgi:hypothetical protein